MMATLKKMRANSAVNATVTFTPAADKDAASTAHQHHPRRSTVTHSSISAPFEKEFRTLVVGTYSSSSRR